MLSQVPARHALSSSVSIDAKWTRTAAAPGSVTVWVSSRLLAYMPPVTGLRTSTVWVIATVGKPGPGTTVRSMPWW